MSNEKTLASFYGLFRGNKDFYIINALPFALNNEGRLKPKFCGFAKYGTKSFPKVPKGFEKGDFVPLTKEQYKEHLSGGNGLSVVPICNTADEKNVCYFAVIDIDVYNTNFTFLVRRLYQLDLRFAAFLSKSGGLHLYFFFKNAESCGSVIKTLDKFVEVFGLNRLFVNEKKKSKVEIFPKQATYIPGDDKAAGIFLPFYDSTGKSPNKMLTTEGKLVGINKAIPVIESLFTSVREIQSVLDNLPYSDAPFCIQMILLTGALSEGDYRSNFICCAAIYLKNKYGGDFDYSLLGEVNHCLESPLEEEEVLSVYKSMTNPEKNYDNYWCSKQPCVNYCDKKLCKLREFGLGRKRGNISTGADCWGLLTRYNAGDGKEPYYTWEVCINENEGFKTLQVDSHKDLLNQYAMQQYCLRDLNWIPTRVRDAKWREIVLQSLEGIEERTIKVAQTADTTELGMLKDSFMGFLTHKQIQKNGQPYMVRLGQVYRADGAYYFTTRGLLDYLRIEKFTLGRFNLRGWLIKEQECIENAQLSYVTASGETKVIECWKKKETEELRALDNFYDDVYDGTADILQKNKLNKEGKEADLVDDTKF